jgi:hypothetical protein
MAPIEYTRARGKLIPEKILSQKSRVKLPSSGNVSVASEITIKR